MTPSETTSWDDLQPGEELSLQRMSEHPMTPSETIHEAHEVDRLTRGRPLAAAEIDCYLADHQTALRHATARVGDEIAEQLRDRLAALSTPPPSRSAEELLATLEVGPDPVYWAGYRDGRCAALEGAPDE